MKSNLFGAGSMVMLISALFAGCNLFGPDSNLSPEAGEKTLADSVMEIPASIRSGATSSRSTAASVRSEIGDLYDLVPHYVQFADEVRHYVAGIVDAVVVNLAWLEEQPRGEKIPIENDPDWVGFLMTDLTDSTDGYDTSLTLYTGGPADPTGWVPRLKLDFLVNESGDAKGTMTLSMAEDLAPTVPGTIHARVVFDAIAQVKLLDIKYYKDISALLTYAEPLPASSSELAGLDLGQPESLSITVEYDAPYYFVSGYSYHPGIELMQDNGLGDYYAVFNPDSTVSQRHTYLFRGSVLTDSDGNEVGGRVAVAFPENGDDFSGAVTAASVWEECAIDGFYTDHMVRVVNDDIVATSDQLQKDYAYIWLRDLLPEVVSTLADDADFSTRFEEFQTWLSTLSAALADNAGAFQSYYDALSNPNGGAAAARPWKVDVDFLLSTLGVDTSAVDFSTTVSFEGTSMTLFEAVEAQVNQWLSWWGDPTTGEATFEAAYAAPGTTASDRSGMLSLVYVPYLLETAETSDYTITEAQLLSFLANSDTDDPEIAEFRRTYQSVTRVVNPAIYVHGTGFVGTYDGTTFYQAAAEALEPTSPTATVSSIVGMTKDETSIATKIPSAERAATLALSSRL